MKWQHFPLSSCVDVNPRDKDWRSLPDDTPVSFVPMACVSDETASIVSPQTRPLREVRKGYTAFRDNDVIFAKITPCMENGKVALATGLTNGRGFGSTEFHVLRARRTVLPEFLYYFVRQSSFRRAAKRSMRGAAGQQRVPAGFISSYPFPLPPISEQRRIVEILDQADRLRKLRAEADAKAERILPALFIKMFGDPDKSWVERRLGELLREKKGALQSGPFGTHLHNSDFLPSGTVLAVGIDNVLDGEFVIGRNRRISQQKYDELKKYTLERGDVLITIMGTVGRTCVFPGTPAPAICTKHVYRIQVNESLHPEYLSAVLRYSRKVRAQLGASVTGQIVAGIKSSDLRRLSILVPPRSIQDEFARRKDLLVKNLRKRRGCAETLNRLFTQLLHRAFTGDLTASWREAHMKELLQEMEHQAKALAGSAP